MSAEEPEILPEPFVFRKFRFVVCNTYQPGYQHSVTRNFTAVYYVVSGQLEVRSGGERYVLKKGDFHFWDNGSTQTLQNLSDQSAVVYIMGFEFADPSVAVRDFGIPVEGSFENVPVLQGIFHKMLETYQEKGEGFIHKVYSCFYSVIYHIGTNQPRQTVFPKEYYHLQNVVKYIEENYQREIRIEDLCRICNYSPAYLRKLFVKYFHMPPVKYVIRTRIEAARELLTGTNKPMSQVAAETGFRDVGYFDKTFKNVTGSTPMEYKLYYYNEYI